MSADMLRPYVFHGVEFQEHQSDAKDAYGICPFCNSMHNGSQSKPRFSVNRTTGQYQCWHCKESGNVHVFLQRILDLALKGTTNEQRKQLAAERRGIPWQQFRDNQFALRNGNGSHQWLIPSFTTGHGLSGLRVYTPGKHIIGTSGLPLSLYRTDSLRRTGPIYLAEGEWDSLALESLRQRAKAPGSVIGVPGAGIWKDEWTPKFRGREVFICYDNDPAGRDGAERVQQLLQKATTNVRRIQWPSTAPEGWDVRDFVAASEEQSIPAPDAWAEFQGLFPPLSATPAPTTAPTTRIDFPTVATAFSERLFTDDNTRRGLALMNAVVLSVQLPGDPIWLFIAGPAGSGKTVLLETLGASPWCVFRSSITPASLISGYMADEDPSLIPQLQGKVLVLKDYTEIIAMPYERQEEIYGILRGAYDGHASKTFGNGIVREYPECHFSVVAGVTDVIHQDNRASLGERFLKFQLVEGRNYDPTKHITAAIHGMAEQIENENYLRNIVTQYTTWWMANMKVSAPPAWSVKRLVALAQVVSYLRAGVVRLNRDELAYRPTPEVGTRLAKQLMKLAQCLAVVYGKKRIDEECWVDVERVALDTCRGWGLDIALTLARAEGRPLLREQIENMAEIPSTTLARRLEGMLAVGTVVRQKLPTARPGHPSFGWTLAPGLQELWKTAKIRV